MKSGWILIFCLATLTACVHGQENKKTPIQELIGDEKQYDDWKKRDTSVDWNNLKKVHEMTGQYLNDYPESPHAQYIAATMAGDYAELLTEEEERAIKSRTAQTLFTLLENPGRFPVVLQKHLRNEYYYHSDKFLDQYLLGCEELTLGNSSDGNFSIGVGGSEHAYQLLKKGEIASAQYFAQRAADAWDKHATATPKWAYPYPYFYIQAMAIAGQTAKSREVFSKVKTEPQYELKKPIYDKYEKRLQEIQRILTKSQSDQGSP